MNVAALYLLLVLLNAVGVQYNWLSSAVQHRRGKIRRGIMFRKKQDVAERSRSLLKSSAAKKLKVDILEQLPSLRKDVLDELMPTKVREARYS